MHFRPLLFREILDIDHLVAVQSLNPVGDSPEEFTRVIAGNYDRLGTLVQALGLKAD